MTTTDFETLANTANAYGITIHGLHPSGPRNRSIDAETGALRRGNRAQMADEYARAFDESEGLQLIANRTGGVFGTGREIEQLLRGAAEDLDTYYSIGYTVSPGNEDRPRKVKVVMKNPNYRARAQETVVRLSEESRLRDRIAANLYFPEQTGQQSPAFRTRVIRLDREGRLLRVALELSIRSSDLFLVPAGNVAKKKGSFSVFVAAGRELGDASDTTDLRQDFDANPNAAAGSPIVYSFETRVRPDTRRISLAVRDNNSGAVSTRIVPLRSE